MSSERRFRFLDGDQERIELVADIRRVRRAVIELAERVPEARRMEPRYDGSTLADVLAHLHLSDRMAMTRLRLALLGTPPLIVRLLDPFSAVLSSVRDFDAALRAIRRDERGIADLVLSLPVDQFSRPVYDPAPAETPTVEQALQEAFLFHWQDMLLILRRAEGIYYEPPTRFDSI